MSGQGGGSVLVAVGRGDQRAAWIHTALVSMVLWSDRRLSRPAKNQLSVKMCLLGKERVGPAKTLIRRLRSHTLSSQNLG